MEDVSADFLVKSPHASTVLSVPIGTKETVAAGDLLVILDGTDEQTNVVKFSAHLERLRAHQALLNDSANNGLTRSRLKAIVDDCVHREALLTNVTAEDFTKYTLGKVDLSVVYEADNDATDAHYDAVTSQLDLDKFDIDLDHSKRILLILIDMIEKEKAYAQLKIDRLSIKAPTDGRLTLLVNNGDPVRRGHLLARIS